MSNQVTQIQDDAIPPFIRMIAPYFFLLLGILVAYGNIFDNGYVFDDDLLIQLDSYLSSWSHVGDIIVGSTTSGAHIAGGFYRPAQILLYLFITQALGGGTFWFHLLNLLLHTANSFFVYRLGTKLGFKPWPTFLATLVWSLHTLHTEAITYMSATADPLFAFFCLWTIVYLFPNYSLRKIIYVIPLFLLGLISKETTAMLPLLVMSCIFFVSPDRYKIRAYLPTWPLWIITIAFVIWRMNAKGFDGPQTYERFYNMHEFANLRMYADSYYYRFLTFFATLPLYLKLLVWPTGLHMERAFSIYTGLGYFAVEAGIVLVILMATQLYRTWRRPNAPNLALSWGILWFATAHSPDTGILFPMNALFLEHWMYLPTAGLFLGLSQTLYLQLRKIPASWSVAASFIGLAFAGMLAVRTYDQNLIWRTPETFYKNIFAYGERSARCYNNLALYYMDQGRYREALDEFTEAVSISDTYAETRYNIAQAYLALPDEEAHIKDVIDNLQRAVIIDPNFYRAYLLLGQIYDKDLHDKEASDYYFKRAATLTSQMK